MCQALDRVDVVTACLANSCRMTRARGFIVPGTAVRGGETAPASAFDEGQRHAAIAGLISRRHHASSWAKAGPRGSWYPGSAVRVAVIGGRTRPAGGPASTGATVATGTATRAGGIAGGPASATTTAKGRHDAVSRSKRSAPDIGGSPAAATATATRTVHHETRGAGGAVRAATHATRPW
jgi:hypothetical protein